MLAVVGSLSRDLVDGGPPRPGGAVVYASRALQMLGVPAAILAKCAEPDRTETLGLPVTWRPARVTTTFSFSYDGDVRRMRVEAVGDAWRVEDVATGLAGVRFVHVGALLRSDFPAGMLAALGRNRVLLLDGQGLVRPGRPGPLRLDGGFDPAALEHIRILKLSEEEAAALGRPVESLGVPEVLLTRGSRGCVVCAGARAEEVSATPVEGVDPTGAGDAFAAAYLAVRAVGEPPVAAARRATALVHELLERR